MEFDYSEIGTNIRKARKKRGITQEELANVADISTQHLCRIENGHQVLKLYIGLRMH